MSEGVRGSRAPYLSASVSTASVIAVKAPRQVAANGPSAADG